MAATLTGVDTLTGVEAHDVSGRKPIVVTATTYRPATPYAVQIEHDGHLVSITREGARDLIRALVDAL